MSDAPPDSPISTAEHAVLTLFTTDLATVSFPGLDRAVLEGSAERVTRASDEVHRVEALLADARAALEESRDALAQTCVRALAYARVYADGNDELTRKIEAMAAPRATRRALRPEESLLPAAAAGSTVSSSRRRGRPRKPGSEVLFHDDVSQTTDKEEPVMEEPSVAA